jgi:hypothetical protein
MKLENTIQTKISCLGFRFAGSSGSFRGFSGWEFNSLKNSPLLLVGSVHQSFSFLISTSYLKTSDPSSKSLPRPTPSYKGQKMAVQMLSLKGNKIEKNLGKIGKFLKN